MSDRPFDHGELNIPLAKRMKGFNARMDRELAKIAADARAESKALRAKHREQMAEAKSLVARIPDARLAQLGKPHNLTIAQTRKMMLAEAWRNPERTIRALSKEASQ